MTSCQSVTSETMIFIWEYSKLKLLSSRLLSIGWITATLTRIAVNMVYVIRSEIWRKQHPLLLINCILSSCNYFEVFLYWGATPHKQPNATTALWSDASCWLHASPCRWNVDPNFVVGIEDVLVSIACLLQLSLSAAPQECVLPTYDGVEKIVTSDATSRSYEE